MARARLLIIAVFVAAFVVQAIGPALGYTVKSGDTLWGLAGSRYGEVARANHIANPDLIYVGQQIDLGKTGSVHASVQAKPAPALASSRDFRDHALRIALAQQGDRYVWGATGPDRFDCSGLMVYAYRQVGKHLPRTSFGQQPSTSGVSMGNAHPGDLLFYPGHVEMYAGAQSGKPYVVAASSAAGGVVVRPMRTSGLLKIGRVR